MGISQGPCLSRSWQGSKLGYEPVYVASASLLCAIATSFAVGRSPPAQLGHTNGNSGIHRHSWRDHKLLPT